MNAERRRAQAEARMVAAEAEYAALLRDALERCAGGVWGLFGQNEHLPGGARPAEVVLLYDLAEVIDAGRSRLGAPPFEMHASFVSLRGRAGSHQAGEPKLAQAWLAEFG